MISQDGDNSKSHDGNNTVPTVEEENEGENHSEREKNSNHSQCEYCEIIVMDDEPDVLKIIKKMFKFFKIDVIETRRGEEVIEIVKERMQKNECIPPILLDIMIKIGLDGIETAKNIKNTCSDTTLIAMSGYAPNVFIINYNEYGFDYAITKPFGLKEIKYIIDNYLKR